MAQSFTAEEVREATYNSCLYNDIKLLRAVMKEPSFDPNIKSANGWTPLTNASIRGNFLCSCCLLSDSAIQIDKKNAWGGTPLFLACQENQIQMVTILIQKGADVNTLNGPDEQTPLGILITSTPVEKGSASSIEIMKILLASGADVNRCGNDGITPLIDACEYNNLEAVQLLVSSGANVDLLCGNNGGGTPLYLAAKRGNYEIVEFLISKGADINTPQCCSVLWGASLEGHLKIVRLLLSLGADVNSEHQINGASPLYIACEKCQYDVVKELIHYGADVNQKNYEMDSPLMTATQHGNEKICRLLINNGAQMSGEGLRMDCVDLANGMGHSDIAALLSRRMQTCAYCGINAAQAKAAKKSKLFHKEEEDIKQREKVLSSLKFRSDFLAVVDKATINRAVEELDKLNTLVIEIEQKEKILRSKKKELLKKVKNQKGLKKSLSKCSGCGETFYCSPSHQKMHWKETHKKECKMLQKKETKKTTHPLELFYRNLGFHVRIFHPDFIGEKEFNDLLGTPVNRKTLSNMQEIRQNNCGEKVVLLEQGSDIPLLIFVGGLLSDNDDTVQKETKTNDETAATDATDATNAKETKSTIGNDETAATAAKDALRLGTARLKTWSEHPSPPLMHTGGSTPMVRSFSFAYKKDNQYDSSSGLCTQHSLPLISQRSTLVNNRSIVDTEFSPLIKYLDSSFNKYVPKNVTDAMRSTMNRCHNKWAVVPDTMFTTLGVHVNFPQHYHKDLVDVKDALACVCYHIKNEGEGGELVLPELGLYVRPKHGDVIYWRTTHVIHGVAPFIEDSELERTSWVMFQTEDCKIGCVTCSGR